MSSLMNLYYDAQRNAQTEARRQLNDDEWSMFLAELDAFVAVLYACGMYCVKGLEVDSLWPVTSLVCHLGPTILL